MLDRALADREATGDFSVGVPGGDQPQDLGFAGAQTVGRRPGGSGTRGGGCDLGRQRACLGDGRNERQGPARGERLGGAVLAELGENCRPAALPVNI